VYTASTSTDTVAIDAALTSIDAHHAVQQAPATALLTEHALERLRQLVLQHNTELGEKLDDALFNLSTSKQALAKFLGQEMARTRERIASKLRLQLRETKLDECEEILRLVERMSENGESGERSRAVGLLASIHEVIIAVALACDTGLFSREELRGKALIEGTALSSKIQKLLHSGFLFTVCPVLVLPLNSSVPDCEPQELVPCGHIVSWLAIQKLNLNDAKAGSDHKCPKCSMPVEGVRKKLDAVKLADTVQAVQGSPLLQPAEIDPSELMDDGTDNVVLGGRCIVKSGRWVAKHIGDGTRGLPVTVEEVPVRYTAGGSQRMNEILALHRLAMLTAPSIARVFGHYYEQRSLQLVLCIVMERLRCSLEDSVNEVLNLREGSSGLESGKARALSDSQVAHIALTISRSVRALHNNLPIPTHCEVTPWTIWLTGSGEPRLLDLRLSRHAAILQASSMSFGSSFHGYAAPEGIVAAQSTCGQDKRCARAAGCSIYGLGQCCIFMALGSLLEDPAEPELWKAREVAWRGEGGNAVDLELVKLVDEMTSKEAAMRPSIDDVVLRLEAIDSRLGPAAPVHHSHAMSSPEASKSHVPASLSMASVSEVSTGIKADSSRVSPVKSEASVTGGTSGVRNPWIEACLR
jgi:hypothetical protein